ncbi:hypothetical protein CVT24_002413 [Panaeolus cyanescens]|uniref:Uncharacterized protein n=1 Tax=Panaeolus cyanescens TaxID=181874 RepID=A0A409W0X5_9AGAR|nr:hypothetical protein CVT24_002413 [Panaeolus cyanescens]
MEITDLEHIRLDSLDPSEVAPSMNFNISLNDMTGNAIRHNIRLTGHVSRRFAFLSPTGTYPSLTDNLAYAQYLFDIRCPNDDDEDGGEVEFMEIHNSIETLEQRHYPYQGDRVAVRDVDGQPCIRLRQFIFTPYSYPNIGLTRSDIVPPFPATNWHVSPDMDSALEAIEGSHETHCLRAFDENGKIIPPVEIVDKLIGREVEVEFRLMHCRMSVEAGYLLG